MSRDLPAELVSKIVFMTAKQRSIVWRRVHHELLTAGLHQCFEMSRTVFLNDTSLQGNEHALSGKVDYVFAERLPPLRRVIDARFGPAEILPRRRRFRLKNKLKNRILHRDHTYWPQTLHPSRHYGREEHVYYPGLYVYTKHTKGARDERRD